MAMPVKNAKITNCYKDPLCKIKYTKGYHTGVDFIGADGQYVPVCAFRDASVLKVGWDPAGWGNYIILRYAGKYDVVHAHLSKVLVSQGAAVKEGQQIGVMGTTGNSTGVHLHFEVRVAPWTNRNDINASNFLGILNQRGPVQDKPIMIPEVIFSSPGDDEMAAAYLARFLKAERRALTAPGDLANVEHAYVIGSPVKPIQNTTNIVGTDRFDTARKTLELCK